MSISYSLKRSTRARTLRISVHPDTRVVVTAPLFLGRDAIGRFVREHAGWVRRKIAEVAGRSVISLKRGEIGMLKKRAHVLVEERSAYFAEYYRVQYKKITIRAQKSRWGSCSRAGNLSFNYKIAALPPHIADYVIVHELCHLVEMNHSKRFWNLVAQVIPEHKAIRRELRDVLIVFS